MCKYNNELQTCIYTNIYIYVYTHVHTNNLCRRNYNHKPLFVPSHRISFFGGVPWGKSHTSRSGFSNSLGFCIHLPRLGRVFPSFPKEPAYRPIFWRYMLWCDFCVPMELWGGRGGAISSMKICVSYWTWWVFNWYVYSSTVSTWSASMVDLTCQRFTKH